MLAALRLKWRHAKRVRVFEKAIRDGMSPRDASAHADLLCPQTPPDVIYGEARKRRYFGQKD